MTSPGSVALADEAAEDDEQRLINELAATSVMNIEGARIRIRDLWGTRRSVTTFVRHFGCLFCHQMVHELTANVPKILARGACVVIVGNGTVEQARYFFSMKKLPREGVSVVTDPERNSYRAAGLERGVVRAVASVGFARAYSGARAQGFRNKGIFGDFSQLGGVLVVEPPASLLFHQKSKFAGDHPNMNDVLAALTPGR
ncbi:MAG TPA: peroxiredoxin-like family protein [Polyangiaceae bacterium]|jgi:peroxiredoxin|nr:peroxiredoxin-like family protein [Polyangiaceae bacterium]